MADINTDVMIVGTGPAGSAKAIGRRLRRTCGRYHAAVAREPRASRRCSTARIRAA